MTRLDAIKARLAAATKGPWLAILGSDEDGTERDDYTLWLKPGVMHAACVERGDAELIANCPTDLAYLIDAVEGLRGALEKIERFDFINEVDGNNQLIRTLDRSDIARESLAKWGEK